MENGALDKKNMGLRIREARERKGWTREQLAEKAEISVNAMASIELGRSGTRLEKLARFCVLLDLNADYILFGTPRTPAEEIADMLRGRDERTENVAKATLRALLAAMDSE